MFVFLRKNDRNVYGCCSIINTYLGVLSEVCAEKYDYVPGADVIEKDIAIS